MVVVVTAQQLHHNSEDALLQLVQEEDSASVSTVGAEELDRKVSEARARLEQAEKEKNAALQDIDKARGDKEFVLERLRKEQHAQQEVQCVCVCVSLPVWICASCALLMVVGVGFPLGWSMGTTASGQGAAGKGACPGGEAEEAARWC